MRDTWMRDTCEFCGRPIYPDHREFVLMDHGDGCGPVPTDIGYMPCVEQVGATMLYQAVTEEA